MRGKEDAGAEAGRSGGITPAHAGKRRAPCRLRWSSGDHPRACGEKIGSSIVPACVSGSPPRMRGKEFYSRCLWKWVGITPAHAGKRVPTRSGASGTRDHPRACGEKEHGNWLPGYVWGSPPRMRGKAFLMPSNVSRTGITPAHAGKRSSSSGWQGPARDHPRACGEKIVTRTSFTATTGSPPRMRGKGENQCGQAGRKGITPAHAGKRRRNNGWAGNTGDHPRACGEKRTQEQRSRVLSGSPPRMRGKVRGDVTQRLPSGITPAHAGKSCEAT